MLPFVRMFFGAPSEYLWEDDSGTVHRIPQGEGGEQGDSMMPLLFCLGQHQALQAIQDQLRDGEYFMAFLDNLYIVTLPDRVGPVYAIVHIRIHCGKTKVWNRAGTRPAACDAFEKWPGSSTHGPQCGRDQVYQPVSKASKSLGHRWTTMILRLPIWSQSWQNTRFSSPASQW